MPTPTRLSLVLPPTAVLVFGLMLSWIGWPTATGGYVFVPLLAAEVLASMHVSSDWPALRLAFVVEFTALMLFGTDAAVIVAGCGLLVREFSNPQRVRWPQRLLEAGAVVAAIRAAASVYLVGGGTFGSVVLPGDAIAITVAVVAYCLVIAVAHDVVVPLMHKARVVGISRVLHESPVYLVAASVAAGCAQMIVAEAWQILAVAAAPLYFAYRLYSDHLHDAEEERQRTETLAREVHEQRRTVQALQRDGERLRLAAEVANDGLWEWDLVTDQFYVTRRWKSMLGLGDGTAIGKPGDWLDRVHAEDAAALKAALDTHLAGTAPRFQHEHRMRHEDGTYKFFQCRGVAARSATGKPVRIVGSLTDTTNLALTQQRLRHAVYLDPLTNLYNRAVLIDSVGRRLEEMRRRPGGDSFALLYLDLDRFKIINDSLGHMVGDQLLVAVSRRLESCLRQGDVLARLGGDEFAILLHGLNADEQANVIAFRVQEALTRPFSIGGREVFTSASIGIAFASILYTSPDEMMHDADTAMYQAKANGKARHEVFDADMDQRARDRLGLENDLRRAVGSDALETHYQPIVSLASGMCVGFESLVRWTRDGKPVSPAMFVPIAEELGLIDRIGTRVLEEACRTFAEWQRMFPEAGLECITVNVSSRQLMQPQFIRIVERAVRDANLEPSALRIEITETALMTDPDEAAKMLRRLRDFGVKIYLDDFGTGYSSLSHLHKLPVDALKIDRSFVRSLSQPDRPAIVDSILALARTLHTSVVAEGIETVLQARELERLGCTHAQGFLFSRPISPASVEQILRARRPLGPKSGTQPPAALATC